MSADNTLLLRTRRSAPINQMQAPGPDAAQLETLLRIATRVPDHGKLTPWRIVQFQGEGRSRFGAFAAKRFQELHDDANEKQIDAVKEAFLRAPLVLVVLATPVEGKMPLIEQHLSTGAVCMNILHAAHAMGFGANWVTGWMAFDETITQHLLEKAGAQTGDIAGIIYIGSVETVAEERERPALDAVTVAY